MYHTIDLLTRVDGSFDPARGCRYQTRFINTDALAQWLTTECHEAHDLRNLYAEGAEAIQAWLVPLWRGLPLVEPSHPDPTLNTYLKQLPQLWKNHTYTEQPIGRPEQFRQGKADLLTKWRKHLQKKRMGLWSATRYEPGTTQRIAKQVLDLNCIVLDYDEPGTNLSEVVEHWASLGYTAIAHESWSSRPGHEKGRIILPLLVPCPADKWRLLWRWAERRTLGQPDPACKDPNRMYYANFGTAVGPGQTHVLWGGQIDWRTLDLKEAPVYREVKRSHVRNPLYDGEQQFTTRSERDALAMKLGARMSDTRAYGIPCPRCGRRSVWFFLEAGDKSSASCNHQGQSCRWNGGLWRLAQ